MKLIIVFCIFAVMWIASFLMWVFTICVGSDVSELWLAMQGVLAVVLNAINLYHLTTKNRAMESEQDFTTTEKRK